MFYIFCFKILDKKGLKQKPDKKCLTKNVKHFLFQMLCFFVRIVVLRSKTKEALFFIFSARKDKEKIKKRYKEKIKFSKRKLAKTWDLTKKAWQKKRSFFCQAFFVRSQVFVIIAFLVSIFVSSSYLLFVSPLLFLAWKKLIRWKL